MFFYLVGNTCSPYRLINGSSGTENRLFSPGTSVQIKCHTPHFHLWGLNTSICTHSLTWSGSTERGCITMSRFRTRCVKQGRTFETRHNKNGYLEPICHERSKISFDFENRTLQLSYFVIHQGYQFQLSYNSISLCHCTWT